MTRSLRRNAGWTIFLAVAAASIVVGLAFSIGASSGLIFSHSTHIEGQGIEDCTVCHQNATESTVATDNLLPAMDACSFCHDVEDEGNCSQCHDRIPQKGQRRIRQTEVEFSHASHVGMENTTCTSCHTTSERRPEFLFGEELMCVVCLNCHRGTPGPTFCKTCHGGQVYLRPPRSHTQDFMAEHGRIILGGRDANCSVCHTQEHCNNCHRAPWVVEDAGEAMVINEPSAYEEEEPLVISRVHEINYRFTHPLDATAKSMECSVCHTSFTTCTECHSPGGISDRDEPLSHSSPDWIGVGGGRHSELARMDMERCVACHDIAGSRPVCLRCHTDPGQLN